MLVPRSSFLLTAEAQAREEAELAVHELLDNSKAREDIFARLVEEHRALLVRRATVATAGGDAEPLS